MKIAIASDDKKTISAHFGRTAGFVVFEMEDKKKKAQEYRPNTFTGHARGLEGADHGIDRHGPILEALKDCDIVISHGMGRRIYDDLTRTGIQAVVTDQTLVENALALYLEGRLVDHPEISCLHKHDC